MSRRNPANRQPYPFDLANLSEVKAIFRNKLSQSEQSQKERPYFKKGVGVLSWERRIYFLWDHSCVCTHLNRENPQTISL